VRVTLVHDESDLLALRGEWDALLRSSRSDSLFLTWEWISTWWRLYGDGRALHVLSARDDGGRLIGLAPLMRVHRRLLGVWPFEALEFIGQGADVTPEHLDFVAAPGLEADVVEAFARQICACEGVQLVDLRPLSTVSPNLTYLERALAPAGGQVRRVPDSVCPVLMLPDTTEQFLQSRSRNYRKKIREYERRCARDFSLRLRCSLTAAELHRDMAVLIDLHHRRWQGRSRAFESPRYVAFHQQIAELAFERGWVRLFTLEADGTPVASLYCFSYGDRYYFYQAGRDPRFARHRVGLVIMHRVVLEAIKEGARVFDFLGGREEYKYRWAESDVTCVRLQYSNSRAVQTCVMRGSV